MFDLKNAYNIVRTLHNPVFNAIYSSDWETIIEYLEDGDINLPVLSDISLGAWLPHQIASEFYQQLNIRFPENIYSEMLNISSNAIDNLFSYSTMIAKGIDGEAIGDISILISYKIAAYLLDHLRFQASINFIVLLPLYGNELNKENEYFLKFFSEGLINTPHKLLLVALEENCFIPSEWTIKWRNETSTKASTNYDSFTLSHLPGILHQNTVTNVSFNNFAPRTIKLNNGYYIPHNILRPDPSSVSRTLFEQLSSSSDSKNIYKPYFVFKSNNFFVDTKFLANYGWKCYAESSPDLAIRYMEKALFCEKDAVQRAILNCQYLGMLIATMRFNKVVDAPQLGASNQPMIRAFLLVAKGWGLVMVNQPEKASKFFNEAEAIMGKTYLNSSVNIKELLYLKNIHALCKLKMGNIEEAIKDELDIYGKSEKLPEKDYRLAYVNAINLARLYKRKNDTEKAVEYYSLAFNTTSGNGSFGDLIFKNFNLASVLAKSNPNNALQHYILMAIHWLSSEIPEALNARIFNTIVNNKLNQDKLVKEEFISKCIYDNIFNCLDVLGKTVINCINFSPFFITSEYFFEQSKTSETLALMSDFGGVLYIKSEVSRNIHGYWYDELAKLIANLLFRNSMHHQLPTTFIIDSQCGFEIPLTLNEMVVCCIKNNIKEIYCNNDTFTIPKYDKFGYHELINLKLSAAVNSIEKKNNNYVISYKRYRNEIVINNNEYSYFKIIAGILASSTNAVSGDAYKDVPVSIIRDLEKKKIIQITLK